MVSGTKMHYTSTCLVFVRPSTSMVKHTIVFKISNHATYHSQGLSVVDRLTDVVCVGMCVIPLLIEHVKKMAFLSYCLCSCRKPKSNLLAERQRLRKEGTYSSLTQSLCALSLWLSLRMWRIEDIHP